MRLLLMMMWACGGTPLPQAGPEEGAAGADVAANVVDEAGAQQASALDVDRPETCAPCHGAVVEAWKGSMHARAHHSEDPLYAAMRQLRIDKQGEHIRQKCANCHHPRATDDLEGSVAQAGVSCGTCHAVDAVGDGAGGEALQYHADAQVRGPHGLSGAGAAVHGEAPPADFLKDGRTLCLACHAVAKNPQGVPTCTTGAEAAQDASCTSCHMPEVSGPSGAASQRASHRSHAFVGPGHAWYSGDTTFLESAVSMAASFDADALVVRLQNTTGHAFPSGFPGRLGLLNARGLDASGAEVWRLWSDDPAAAPDAMLTKVYVDAEGAPVMPPFAAALKSDTRLTPDEARTLRWQVPEAVASAEVWLDFHLAPPKALRVLKLDSSHLAKPKRVATAEASR